MDLKKGINIHHHHFSLGMIIFILMIVVVILMIKPALEGYKFKSQFDQLGEDAGDVLKGVEQLKSSLLIVETKLENSEKLKDQYFKELNDEKSKTLSCLEEKRQKEAEIGQLKVEYSFNVTKLKSEYEQKKDVTIVELDELKIKFNDLSQIYNETVKNAANNLCCKARVDDSSIDSYLVSGNKIVCSSDAVNEISC